MTVSPASPRINLAIFDSPETQLDDILLRISERIELPPHLYEQAVERYELVGKWLAEGRLLAAFQPVISPIGSMRMGTTNRPKGRTEFDVDLLCQLGWDVRGILGTLSLLDVVEARLRENSNYSRMMRRDDRCIRIEYADEFNLDIVPSIPDPASSTGAVLIFDQASNKWIGSNPVGYAEWFKRQSEIIAFKEYRSVEELPEQEAAAQKSALQRVVQLLKRARDQAFGVVAGLDEQRAPESIVLSTLAAEQFNGETTVAQALTNLISNLYRRTREAGPKLVVHDPVIEGRRLSEKWENDVHSYGQFVEWIAMLYQSWMRLRVAQGEEVEQELRRLFGETVTVEAYTDQAKSVRQLHLNGNLHVKQRDAKISVASTVGASSIPRNTFYGK